MATFEDFMKLDIKSRNNCKEIFKEAFYHKY